MPIVFPIGLCCSSGLSFYLQALFVEDIKVANLHRWTMDLAHSLMHLSVLSTGRAFHVQIVFVEDAEITNVLSREIPLCLLPKDLGGHAELPSLWEE